MSNVPQPSASPPPTGTKPDLTMAWLSHLLLLFTGFIGPLIIWLVKKDQDKLAAFHGKQAFFFSLAMIVVYIALAIFFTVVGFLIPPLLFVMPCLFPLIGLGVLAYVIYAIVATSGGKPFKYVFVADMFCKKEFAEAYPGV